MRQASLLVVKAGVTMLESLVIAKPNLACYSLGSLWVTETASGNPRNT